ncbi:HAD family hydrolase [Amycolatopsis jiangsuensis]|uniref:FMN phosphatase YigB (HAD superfamily) n=1 Tax=Amycolatopsis jiangsuensis TaxID=1181879 RepID=A0A840J6T5_9PSEU|nr:HAD-IA family hydrolase [Amycolatopsis jiangsuensis]MBB4689315.1 FMN phosphatase YigB (HAD superfamily) [Amycolatopsis jiangsuensis]
MGVADNQTEKAARLLRALELPADAVATSGERGVAKSEPAFFGRVIVLALGEPDEIIYFGDHRDNDIMPARAAGLRPVLLHRGPWGYLRASDPVVRRDAEWVSDSAEVLPGLVGAPSG